MQLKSSKLSKKKNASPLDGGIKSLIPSNGGIEMWKKRSQAVLKAVDEYMRKNFPITPLTIDG